MTALRAGEQVRCKFVADTIFCEGYVFVDLGLNVHGQDDYAHLEIEKVQDYNVYMQPARQAMRETLEASFREHERNRATEQESINGFITSDEGGQDVVNDGVIISDEGAPNGVWQHHDLLLERNPRRRRPPQRFAESQHSTGDDSGRRVRRRPATSPEPPTVTVPSPDPPTVTVPSPEPPTDFSRAQATSLQQDLHAANISQFDVQNHIMGTPQFQALNLTPQECREWFNTPALFSNLITTVLEIIPKEYCDVPSVKLATRMNILGHYVIKYNTECVVTVQ